VLRAVPCNMALSTAIEALLASPCYAYCATRELWGARWCRRRRRAWWLKGLKSLATLFVSKEVLWVLGFENTRNLILELGRVFVVDVFTDKHGIPEELA